MKRYVFALLMGFIFASMPMSTIAQAKKSEGAAKAQAYQDALMRHDFTDFCHNYPNHSKCFNIIQELEAFFSISTIFFSFVLISPIVTAIVAGHIAREKNRTWFGWFLMGLFFNIFGVIAICTLSNRR